ncbi:MAG TPA: hypothetical protein VGN07_16245 [Steroidobacteraceae bacterium]
MSQFEPLERSRFFTGQLLSAEDLQREQDYFLGRLRRHNRLMHGWGIVSGLHTSVAGGATVVVEPGLAIDCAGNEIVLATPQQLSITGSESRLYVTICYAEVLTGEVTTTNGVQFSRARESAVVEILSTNPSIGHPGMGQGTAGCGNSHGICTATIGRRGSRWRITSRQR